MAQIISLYDRQSHERQYPVTSTHAVLNERGEDVDALFAQESQRREASIEAALKGYATTDALAAKQAKLTPSADFLLTPGGNLSLTEQAKRALFVDLWNQACGSWGRYNEQTGFFELNGITDITYEEALKIYDFSKLSGYETNFAYRFATNTEKVRTILPIRANSNLEQVNFIGAFAGNDTIEVITILRSIRCSSMAGAFSDCRRLRIVNANFWSGAAPSSNTFRNCESLEDITLNLSITKTSLYLQWSPNLSLNTLSVIANKQVPDSLTHYVHPEVYAKLTDPDNAEWYAVTLKAQKNNISFAAKEPT